jgi:L-threonylcarbamoyladenylate synthase
MISVAYVADGLDDKVVELLKKGDVGLIPTDTIYGLSARALDEAAVERIHTIKGRDAGKPLIVLISDIKMLDLLSISAGQARIIERYWPGRLSFEFQAPDAPAWLHRGQNHFAIRLPDYEDLRNLIRKAGPIVSTSANKQGGEPARSIQEAQALFGDKLDFYVDAGRLDNPPSTLAEFKNGQLRVVRQGAVKIKADEV